MTHAILSASAELPSRHTLDARLDCVKPHVSRTAASLPWMVSRTRAVKALLELIREMATEREHAWGWKGEVARELGIHESLVGKLETGERTGVSLDTVEKIAQRSARYRKKLDAAAPVAPPAPAPDRAEQVTETRAPRRDAADASHWLKHTLDAWSFEGRRREAVIEVLEAAAPPLQPQTVRALVDMWLRLEKLEAAAAKPDASSAAGKHSEARGGRRLAAAKPAKRLK